MPYPALLHTLLPAVALLIVTARATAQCTLQGTVRAVSGAAVPGAMVRVAPGDLGAFTNMQGRFRITGIPPGRRAVTIRMVGYRTRIDTVDIAGTRTVERDFTLSELEYALSSVEVSGERRRGDPDAMIAPRELTPDEIVTRTGAAEDVLRALQTLPGVVSSGDFSAQLYVRGSGPDENVMLVDDVEVYNPYRLYGGVSMFNPATVRAVRLHMGGAPAQFGDGIAAVLEVENREGRRERPFTAGFNLSLASANIVCEGPVAMRTSASFDTSAYGGGESIPWNGSWIASARRTYYDLVAGPLARSSGFATGNIVLPNFIDFQFKLALQMDYRNKLTLLGLTSRDNTVLTAAKDINTIGDLAVNDVTFNDLFAGTWTHVAGEHAVARSTASFFQLGGSNSFSGVMTPSLSLGMNISTEEFERLKDSLRRQGLPVEDLMRAFGSYRFLFRKLAFKHAWLVNLSESHELDAGAAVDLHATELKVGVTIDPRNLPLRQSNPRLSALPSFAVDSRDLRAAAYAQDLWRVTDRLSIRPGLRAEYFGLIDRMYLSPRLSASYALTPVSTLRGAVGVYHQSPGYEKQFSPGYEVYLTRTVYDLSAENARGLVAEKALHGVLGWDIELSDNLGANVEAYGKKLSDLITPKIVQGTMYVVDPIPGGDPRTPSGWSAPYGRATDSLTNIPVNGGTGTAFGLEITVGNRRRAREDRLSWAVSYALSRARRTWQGHEFAYDYDRTHTLAIDVGWRLSDDLELSARWTYGTGFPNNQPAGIRPRVYLKTDSTTHTTAPTLDTDFKGVVFDVDRGGMDNLNASRFPDYHRLDVRLSARPRWFGWEWNVYLEIINVYNRANVAVVNYAVDRDTMKLISIPLSTLPVLPNIGVHVIF